MNKMKKILSLVLALSMLSGLGIVTAQADTTDAISKVVADTTNYVQWGNQYNRIAASTQNASHAFATAGIGGDTNGCVKATVGNSGIATESRWHQAYGYPNADGLVLSGSYGSYDIASATTPVYWSVDVYSNDITEIRMQVSSVMMHNSRISSSQLKANEWNTLAIAYYPNTTDTSKCGYADLYINGEYQDTKDLSSVNSTATQTRFYYNFASESAGANGVYFDNFKVYEMTSFTRPYVDTTSVNVTGGLIEGFTGKLVSELEAVVGATVYNSDGTEAADTDVITSDMTVADKVTITGVGIFTDSYGFHPVDGALVDTTDYTQYADSWNRVTQSSQMNFATPAVVSGIGNDPNVSLKLQVGSAGVDEISRFAVGTCNDDGTFGEKLSPADATKPVYWSVDVWGGSEVEYVWLTLQGTGISPKLTMSDLTADKWNTLSAVYYPASYVEEETGYADFYLNGQYINSYTNITSDKTEYRFICDFAETDDILYIDNLKVYTLSSFERPEPEITDGSMKLANGVITGYGTVTVSQMESKLGVSVLNSDGTTPDSASTVKAGMKAVFSSTVAGVGTFTNTCTFGLADKVLVTEDFTSATSYTSVLSDRIGFSHKREAGQIGGKSADDGYLKITTANQDDGSDGTKDCRFAVGSEFTTDGTSGRLSPMHGDPLIYSIDVYPAADMKSIQFDTGATVWSAPVDAKALNQGEWNNITFVFYTTKFSPEIPQQYTWESDIYVNGTLYSRAHSDYATPKVGHALRFHIITAATGDVTYIDNISVVSAGSFVRPELSSDSYIITESKKDKATIGGYKGMTVSELKAGATASDESVTVTVYNSDGTVADANAVAEKGMYMLAEVDLSGDEYGAIARTYTRKYVLEAADYLVNAPIGYANGYVDKKFGKGTYTVDTLIDYYASEVNISATLAQLDSDGEEINSKTTDVSLTETATVSVALDITETKDTYLLYTLKNKTTDEVLLTKIINPYDMTVIEKAVKLYPTFTTKAVTFGYDDGVTSDAETVALFNKYGAKATFNLIGKKLESYYGTDFAETVKAQYQGHEIANHTFEHKPSHLMEGEVGSASDGTPLYGVSLADAIADVTTNSAYLKEHLGVTTRGIAWPNGFPSAKRTDYAELEAAVMADGHVYARYSENGKYELPTDWMQWAPTCHHKYLEKYTDPFVAMENDGEMKLFFVWGHSYEFKNAGDDETLNWTLLENALKKLKADNVWFATHGEIYDYVNALDEVEIGDYSVKNNSDMTVYMHINGESITLEAGEEYVTEPRIFVELGADKTARIYSNNAYGSIVAASYADNGALIEASEGESEATVSYDGVSKVRGMLLKSLSSLKPLTKSLDINIKTPDVPTIVCWGDSLTYGQESTDPATKSYPAVLANLTGGTVYNMGIGGENATTIAARQGVLDIVTTEDFVIPAEGEVEIAFGGSNGGSVAPRNTNLAGWNPCEIAGVKGTLSATVIKGANGSQNVPYATFTRSEKGTPIKVKAGERISVEAQDLMGDINIIFSGTNGGWSDTNVSAHVSMSSADKASEIKSLVDLIEKQGKKSKNPDKYIVLGLISGTKTGWQDLTDEMSERFGEKFIDLRAELSNEEVLTEAGITPTSEDLTAIANGEIPPSLQTDGTHFIDAGYKKIAELVYNKLKELGYII